MFKRSSFVVGALALAALSARCGAPNSFSDGGSTFYDAGYQGRDASGRSDVSTTDAMLPPEIEEQRAFETPQAGGRYVYVANPTRNTVAVIDATTLDLQTVEAGDGPRYLRTLDGRDEALVVNEGSDDVTILRTDTHGTRSVTLPAARDANAITIAPDGRHALVWFDSSAPGAQLTSGSLQDVTLLTLEEGHDASLGLSVGFRPLQVDFARDGSAAFVITEDGLSILRFADITGPTILPSISRGESDTGAARDVSVAPDGRYAVARFEGSPVLELADLTARTITSVDLGAPVTDVDLAPDGSFALAVLRDQSTVLRIPLPLGFTDVSRIVRTELPGETVGSVVIAPDALHALVYTTAAPIVRITILDLAGTDAPDTVRLRKPIRAVAIAPDGHTALVIHTRLPGDPADPTIDLQTRIDRSYGYTLLDLPTGFAKLQLTGAEVGPFAIVPDGSAAFVLLSDPRQVIREVQRISLRSFIIDPITLGSPPLSVGVVPGSHRAFVGQDHPEGRITFIDWTTGALQSLTGFELNSRVVM
ncbi:MAG: hypothetical protein WCJ30_14925 [Deltaproteobacteria bacterium]